MRFIAVPLRVCEGVGGTSTSTSTSGSSAGSSSTLVRASSSAVDEWRRARRSLERPQQQTAFLLVQSSTGDCSPLPPRLLLVGGMEDTRPRNNTRPEGLRRRLCCVHARA